MATQRTVSVTRPSERLLEHNNTLLEVIDCDDAFLTQLRAVGAITERIYSDIGTKNCNYMRNEYLLQILRCLDIYNDVVHPKFINALSTDYQEHVANLLECHIGPLPLEHAVREHIAKVKPIAAAEMYLDPSFLAALKSKQVILERHEAAINQKPAMTNKSICLINIVLRRSDQAHKDFLECLQETGQNRAADLLQTTDGKVVTVHVTLLGAEDDAVLSDQMNEFVMTPDCCSVGKAILQRLKDFGLFLCGTRPSDSISFFIICNNEQAFKTFCKLEKSGALKKSLNELINAVVSPKLPFNISIKLDDKDFERCRKYFAEQHSTDMQAESPKKCGVSNILSEDIQYIESAHSRNMIRVMQPLIHIIRRIDRILLLLREKDTVTLQEYDKIKSLSMFDGTALLLNMLCKKPIQHYECFLSALDATNQHHLRLLLEGVEVKFQHQNKIRENLTFLTDNILTGETQLLEHLRQLDVLDENEIESIKAQVTKLEKAVKLLDYISRSSEEQYHIFIKSLIRCGQRFIVDQLEGNKTLSHLQQLNDTQFTGIDVFTSQFTELMCSAMKEDKLPASGHFVQVEPACNEPSTSQHSSMASPETPARLTGALRCNMMQSTVSVPILRGINELVETLVDKMISMRLTVKTSPERTTKSVRLYGIDDDGGQIKLFTYLPLVMHRLKHFTEYKVVVGQIYLFDHVTVCETKRGEKYYKEGEVNYSLLITRDSRFRNLLY